RVLDVGCGVGSWAIVFAGKNPRTNVLAMDLSSMLHTLKPTNLIFRPYDVTDSWNGIIFGYIHICNMSGSLVDWKGFYEKIFQHLEPGGWVEQVEHSWRVMSDEGVPESSSFYKLSGLLQEIGRKTGKSFDVSEEMVQHIENAGFSPIRQHSIKVPIGGWPEDKEHQRWGTLNQMYLGQALEGIALRGLTKVLKWDCQQALNFLAEVKDEIENRNNRLFIRL
ncbi:S-adenosyl-L-methionine-dependent methyltransferase, partial [Thozetella sp. PMI_491]